MAPMRSRRRDSSTSRGLLRPAPILGGLVVVALGLLAIPFAKAPSHASAVQSDLAAAKSSLAAGDIDAAEASVQSARRHADQVQDAVQGFGGDVWSWVPVAGGPVRDVRHLGNALDDLTAVAEEGVGLLPQVRGDASTLFDNGSVDLDTL